MRSSPSAAGLLPLAPFRPRLIAALREGIETLPPTRRAALQGQVDAWSDGAPDRGGRPDLYYSVFAALIRAALCGESNPIPMPPLSALAPDELHLVHLASWIRLQRLAAAHGADVPSVSPLIERFRRPDGGYAPDPAAPAQITAAYLALNAWQDLDRPLPHPDRLLAFIESCRMPDGYANNREWPVAIAPATCAALHIRAAFDHPPEGDILAWLAAFAQPCGGFGLFPNAPRSDLLSTGVILFTLLAAQAPSPPTPLHRDWIDSCWRTEGGFAGDPADPRLDAEYTFYGLLALAGLARAPSPA